MEFLKIRRGKAQLRADGSRYAVPLYVTKTRRMGNTISEETISTKRPLLVTGAHDAGKTRWLKRMHEHASEIWGTKSKTAPLYLDTLSPLAAWCDNTAVATWWEQARLTDPDPETARLPWKTLKAICTCRCVTGLLQGHGRDFIYRRCTQAQWTQTANCTAMCARRLPLCDSCQ